MMPNTSSKLEGLQNKCCDKYLDYHHDGDGVEWEIWKCDKCKQNVLSQKKMIFWDLADVLIFSIKQFTKDKKINIILYYFSFAFNRCFGFLG